MKEEHLPDICIFQKACMTLRFTKKARWCSAELLVLLMSLSREGKYSLAGRCETNGQQETPLDCNSVSRVCDAIVEVWRLTPAGRVSGHVQEKGMTDLYLFVMTAGHHMYGEVAPDKQYPLVGCVRVSVSEIQVDLNISVSLKLNFHAGISLYRGSVW